MIKFKEKKHIGEDKHLGKIVIYYNVSDIFLDTILLVLVVFFINDYLSHSLTPENYDNFSVSENYLLDQYEVNRGITP